MLEVERLSVSYGRATALRDVDLAVPTGSVVGVLGANGAGKSTLLRCIAGLVAPRSGRILLDGSSIGGLSPHEVTRRGVCLIPEGRGILPTLTVAENLRLSLGSEPDSIEDVYARFGVLADRRQQLAGTLSGGEQQMLALARAFGRTPRLLMLDEPSLGLAPRLVQMVVEVISHLHADRGRTILWVEQYASKVLELADLVYVVGRGRLVWAGQPSEIAASDVLSEHYLGGTPPRS